MIKNLNKINSFKRSSLQRVLEYLERNNNRIINRIIVFGLSITDDCTENSDIDICIDSNYNYKFNEDYYKLKGQFISLIDDKADSLRYCTLNEDFKKNVINRGVVIYEQ